jgi:hypothetical protein
MAQRKPRGAVGGYFPYSFPRNRTGFLRACIFFDRVELFLPNPIDGFLIPSYEEKFLKTSYEAFNRFLLEIKLLVEADVVTPVAPGRPDGFVGNSLYGEQFWWELGDAPYQAESISDDAKRLVLSIGGPLSLT